MTAMLERIAPTELVGSTTPRLWTRPLVAGPPGPCGCGCALTPATSVGFAVAEFAEELDVQLLGGRPGEPVLLPWQRWFLIHMLELRPDGLFRFKTAILLVSRQNGKTRAAIVLALFMSLIRGKFVGSAAQNLTIAGEAWQLAVDLLEADDEFSREIQSSNRRYGAQKLVLANRGRWQVAAATRKGARGLSGVDLLLVDELREQLSWDGWAALDGTTTARAHAITIGLSNAGDDSSIVLNTLSAQAHAGGNDAMGIFEWSAPLGCELGDRAAWVAANPGLGYTISERTLISKMSTLPPNQFRAEHLCQKVDALDAALDVTSWRACADEAGGLSDVRDRVTVCVSVADGGQVTLAGAALRGDGRVRVLVGRHWADPEAARQDLPGLLQEMSPAAVGWFPSGPGAVLSTDLRPLGAVEIVGMKVTEACQQLSDLVTARRVLQPGDPDLDVYVARAKRKRTGDGWRFAEWGPVYALAGAVWLARTLPAPPPPPPRPRIF